MAFLYKHQRDIIAKDPLVAGLWLGTGSGKTLTALSLARGKTLIICPKTQKEDQNWERECFRARLAKNIETISKETFRRDRPLGKVARCKTLIVDEAHTCLGVTPNTRQRKKQTVPKASQLYEELKAYIDEVKPERVYLCTATIMKSPMTVWAAGQILGYVDDTGEPWDFFAFRSRFYTRLPMPGREVWQSKSDDDTKELLASLVKKLGFVGRLEDYFDVPPQTHTVKHIDLTDKQKKRIKELSLEYPEPIIRVGKIHSVENGVLSKDEFNKAEFFDNGKIDAILDISVEFPRFVVFAKYRAQIDQIASALREKGRKVLILTGDTKDRGAVIKEANDLAEKGKDCVFIVSAQISAGWELPCYNCMVFASRTYSYVDFSQSLGRIQRANNIKRNLYIYLVVKNATDEAVHKCLENKQDFDERMYAQQ